MGWVRAGLLTSFIVTAIVAGILLQQPGHVSASDDQPQHGDRSVALHALRMIDRGRTTFRYDTFGDGAEPFSFIRQLKGKSLEE